MSHFLFLAGCDELLFFLSRQGLYLQLPAKGLAVVPTFLPVEKLQRSPSSCILGTLSLNMGRKSPIHIHSDSRIQSAVTAAENV